MDFKILVGCPTSHHKEYCLKEYIRGVRNLSYKNFDFLLVDNSETDNYSDKIKAMGIDCIKIPFIKGVKKRLAESREILRKKVLDEGYDYFLSLEQDIIPPIDIIEKLLAHGKEVVCALYTKNTKVKYHNPEVTKRVPVPVIFGINDEKTGVKRLFMHEIKGKGLIRIFGAGLGCILIHKSVLEKIKFRVEDPFEGHDDMYFFRDIHKLGISAYCDVNLHCKHLELIWDASIKNS